MFKKTALGVIAAAALSACVDGGGEAVMRNVVNDGVSCAGSPHMQTAFNLPVRCGPQRVSPYTFAD